MSKATGATSRYASDPVTKITKLEQYDVTVHRALLEVYNEDKVHV